MSDQTPLPNPEGPQAAEPGRRHSHAGGWVPGVILVVLGLLFLLNNLSGFELHNWWALFILIPAFDAFRRAWKQYNQAGVVNRDVRQPVFSGLLLTVLTAVFLFNLSWMLFGPALLILLGLTLLGNEILP